MAVERCPSCDARYDVSTLDRGGTFVCKRCQASVVIGGARAARSERMRPALLVTGVLMFLSLFLYANPAFGGKAANWPWQHFAEASSISRKADLLLWVLVSVMATAFGLGYGGKHRFAWLAAPLLLLVARCYGQGAAFTAVTKNEPTFGWFLSVACLGAAAAVLGTASVAGRGTARTLAWLGALGVLVAYSITFQSTGHSLVTHYSREFAQVTDALFQGGEHEPGTVAALWKQWWGRLLPMAVQIVACLLAVVLAVIPSERRGAGVRILAWSMGTLLMLRWVGPLLATFYYERAVLSSGGASGWALLIARTVFDSGLGLWVIASFSLAALVRELGAAADAAAVSSGSPPRELEGTP